MARYKRRKLSKQRVYRADNGYWGAPSPMNPDYTGFEKSTTMSDSPFLEQGEPGYGEKFNYTQQGKQVNDGYMTAPPQGTSNPRMANPALGNGGTQQSNSGMAKVNKGLGNLGTYGQYYQMARGAASATQAGIKQHEMVNNETGEIESVQNTRSGRAANQ